MCTKPPQKKHFLSSIALCLFFSLLLSHTSCHLHSFSALLSSLILISSTLLYLFSTFFFLLLPLFPFFFSALPLPISCYILSSSFLFIFLLLTTNIFYSSNIFVLFSIIIFNILTTSYSSISLTNSFIFN